MNWYPCCAGSTCDTTSFSDTFASTLGAGWFPFPGGIWSTTGGELVALNVGVDAYCNRCADKPADLTAKKISIQATVFRQLSTQTAGITCGSTFGTLAFAMFIRPFFGDILIYSATFSSTNVTAVIGSSEVLKFTLTETSSGAGTSWTMECYRNGSLIKTITGATWTMPNTYYHGARASNAGGFDPLGKWDDYSLAVSS